MMLGSTFELFVFIDEGGLLFTARITHEDDDFSKPALTRNLGKGGTTDQR